MEKRTKLQENGLSSSSALPMLPSGGAARDAVLSDAPLPPFGQRAFSVEEHQRIQEMLSMRIPRSAMKERVGAGNSRLTYVSHDTVINVMNGIFGPMNTTMQVKEIRPDFQEKVSEQRRNVGIYCIVRVTLKNGAFREDIGYGLAQNMPPAAAYEKAYKEAQSDATKRCLRNFGSALGLCLYDKAFTADVKLIPSEEQTFAHGYLPVEITEGKFYTPSMEERSPALGVEEEEEGEGEAEGASPAASGGAAPPGGHRSTSSSSTPTRGGGFQLTEEEMRSEMEKYLEEFGI